MSLVLRRRRDITQLVKLAMLAVLLPTGVGSAASWLQANGTHVGNSVVQSTSSGSSGQTSSPQNTQTTPQNPPAPPEENPAPPGEKPAPSKETPPPAEQEPEPSVKNPEVRPAQKVASTPTLTIPRLSRAPVLEDFLSMKPQGPAALEMAKVTGFTQRNPHDGEGFRRRPKPISATTRKICMSYSCASTIRRRCAPACRAAKTFTTTTKSRSCSTRFTTGAAPTLSRPRRWACNGTQSGPKLLGRRSAAISILHSIRFGIRRGKVTEPGIRRLDGDSLQEPALSRRPSSRNGASFCIAALRAKTKTRSGRRFPTKWQGGWARQRRFSGWKESRPAAASS